MVVDCAVEESLSTPCVVWAGSVPLCQSNHLDMDMDMVSPRPVWCCFIVAAGPTVGSLAYVSLCMCVMDFLRGYMLVSMYVYMLTVLEAGSARESSDFWWELPTCRWLPPHCPHMTHRESSGLSYSSYKDANLTVLGSYPCDLT